MKTGDYYLGFDASCGTCGKLAAKLESEFEGRVSVLSLSDPRMEEWRHKALGAEAPWLPTLVRVRPNAKEACVGWKIGRFLCRRSARRPHGMF